MGRNFHDDKNHFFSEFNFAVHRFSKISREFNFAVLDENREIREIFSPLMYYIQDLLLSKQRTEKSSTKALFC